ncbi:MAG TPA: hypothetical protein DDZ44_04370 [Syntrophomonas wolfei]|uniref:N-acetylmuramoyl-L-alanine amidase n=1 Tax=Syntrophomonas wolfei TaxID=863 RepID=A0A354YWR5_9FIRM|nr:hypothetical protein [Syntrophomonas wolfei]
MKFNGLKRRSSTHLIVLHHSASPDVPAAEIHAWHLTRGWAGIGYHFVIRKNGSIERGRPLEAIGAHAGPGINGVSIGICLCGNFMKEMPEADQIESLIKLIAWLNLYYAAANPKGLDIKLHREVAATDCPGKLFPVEQIRGSISVPDGDEGGMVVEAWKTDLMREAQRIGLIQEEHQPDDVAPKWFVLAVALHVLESIKNGGKELEQ